MGRHDRAASSLGDWRFHQRQLCALQRLLGQRYRHRSDPPTYPPPGVPPTPQPGGFGVNINDGALYTNDSGVTVRTWAPNITHQRLSNDGGYSDEGWMSYQITTTWVLSTYSNYVMPRYVYAWFRDEGSSIYGPYFDDIIYDPVAPEGQVSILGSEVATVTLWLEAWDDNSGVIEMKDGSIFWLDGHSIYLPLVLCN